MLETPGSETCRGERGRNRSIHRVATCSENLGTDLRGQGRSTTDGGAGHSVRLPAGIRRAAPGWKLRGNHRTERQQLQRSDRRQNGRDRLLGRWCGPCKSFAPVYTEVSGDYADVIFGKVDVDANPGLAQAFGVTAIPTLVVMRNGQVLTSQAGAMNGPSLRSTIDKALKGPKKMTFKF